MSGMARAARWGAGTLAGIGVRDLAGALAVVLVVVAALCWVLANEDRSRRLTEILGAWRGAAGQVVGQSGVKATRRRRGRAGAGSGRADSGTPSTG